jgi:hypothetical protein
MKRHLLGVAAAVLGTVLISGAGFAAATASAAPVPTTVTLPTFGAPLTLTITTDPGGALTNVAVDSANTANYVATKLKSHKVVFESVSTTNPARIVVKSGHGGQSVSAHAGSLAEVSGPGVWSGDVFGTGTASTVNFTVVAKADGTPDITNVASSAGGVVGAVDYSSGDGHEGDSGSSARVSVKFTNAAGDQSRSLTIAVRLNTNEHGDTSAKLSISLGRIRGVEGMAVGSHVWSGTLCDNTAATIAYTVAADGTLTLGAIAPATATSSTGEEGATVTFATGERVRISSKMDDHGQVRVSVKVHIDCNSGNPVTNVSTSIPTPDNGGGNGHLGGSGRSDHKGGKNG